MTMLVIKLFGTLHISLDGKNLRQAFRTDKERALLVYLAMEAGRTFRREALAELLWPDRPAGAGRTNLRQGLLGIRRALQSPKQEESFLEIEDESLGFRPGSGFTLDSREFAGLVQLVRAHQHAPGAACAACHEKLQAAFDLYAGDLLEGYFLGESTSFFEWLVVQRENLLEDYLYVLTMLSEQAFASRDFSLGVHFARQLVAKVPLDERAQRLLIRLLAESGQRSAALEQYESCQRLLAQELGIEPSQQTKELYEKVRLGEVAQKRFTGSLQQRSNLPGQLTTFAGRVKELRWFDECLANPVCRLITLIGMAGTGKTRLALQVGTLHIRNFQDGVWLVTAESIQNTDQLIFDIGRVLGVHFDERLPQRSQMVNHLRDKELLLILDGFDHLIPSTELLLEILQYAPGVKILVTAQTRLDYQAVCLHELFGLEFPSLASDPQAMEYPAVQLFLARAARIRPGYFPETDCLPHIVRICSLVQGLPLAIELAASGLRNYSCAQIASEIEKNIDSLHTNQQDVPERHRSIRAALDHTWLRLSGMEMQVQAGLAVFEGGFTTSAAQGVIGADLGLLGSLSGKSLLQQDNRQRYYLQPLVRSYSWERLARLDHALQTVRLTHSKYYLSLVAGYEERLVKGQDLCQVIDEIGGELGNIRSALTTALEFRQYAPLAQAAEALIQYFEISSNVSEGERFFSNLVAALVGRADNFLEKLVLAQSYRAVGQYQARRGLLSPAGELLGHALEILMQIQADESAVLLGSASREITSTLNTLGFIVAGLGDFQKARDYFDQAMDIASHFGDDIAWANGLLLKTELEIGSEDLDTLLADYQRCLRIFEANQDRRGLLRVLIDLGDTAFQEKNYARARVFYERALEQIKPLDTGWASAAVSYKLGAVEKACGNLDEAWRLNQSSLEIYAQIGDIRRTSAALSRQGELACLQDNCSVAAKYHDEALRLAIETGSTSVILNILVVVSRCYASTGNITQALQLLNIIQTHPAASRSTQKLAGALLADMVSTQNKPCDAVQVYQQLLLSPFVRKTVNELLRSGNQFHTRAHREIDPFDVEIFD
jgi:DNA-binding SARP family transcriptional activator/predicted ATPase